MADINVYDEIAIIENINIVRHLSLSISDSISISEAFGSGDFTVNDSISVSEYINIIHSEDFSQFLRSYPYQETTLTGVEKISLGGGYVQILDHWGGVTKKQFSINFPVFTKEEIKAVRDFYEIHYGDVFYFTEPIWSESYRVIIVENSWVFSRDAYDTYFAGFKIEEYL